MPDISKIQLPGSNTVYNIKDEVARAAIAAGFKFLIAWSGDSTPDRSLIPDVVTVYYNNTAYTGTLTTEDAEHNTIYLIRSTTELSGENDYYDEYVTAQYAGRTAWEWEKLGDTQIELSNVVTGVTLNKQTTNFITGYESLSKTNVIGSGATFSVTQPTITVTPAQTYLGATASGTTVGGDGTATVNKSNWSFTMGTGSASETLIISGGNGDDKTCLMGVKVTTQPTITLATNSSTGTGRVQVVTGLSSATATNGSVSWNNKDVKTAVIGLGTPSTAAGLNNSTSITVTKGA